MTFHFAAEIEPIGIVVISDTAVSTLASGERQRVANAQKINASGNRAVVMAAGESDTCIKVLDAVSGRLDDVEQAVDAVTESYYDVFNGYKAEFIIAGLDKYNKGRILKIVPLNPAGSKLGPLPFAAEGCAAIGMDIDRFRLPCASWISGSLLRIEKISMAVPPPFLALSHGSRAAFGLGLVAGGLIALCEEVAKELGVEAAVGGPWHSTIIPYDGTAIHQPTFEMYNQARSIAGLQPRWSPA